MGSQCIQHIQHSAFTQHSIQENFPMFQEFLIACNNPSSFPFTIINLPFYSYGKCCLRVLPESILSFIGSACHETRSGGPYTLILGGCRCSLLYWYTWQWNTENLGGQNIIGRQFQVKEQVSFRAGCLRDVFAEIPKCGGRLWWKLPSESPPLTPAESKPCLLHRGMMLCCHLCTEGQGSWFSFSITLKQGVCESL